MRIATGSSMVFHQNTVPSTSYSRHLVSFQPGAVASSSSMIHTGMSGFCGANNTAGMIFTGESCGLSNMEALIPVGSPAAGLQIDPVPGLKYDTGLASNWTAAEQAWLEEGLVMYAHEPTIMKYVKIAAMLQNKTVRDVALRCCWMAKRENGKRRKKEDCYNGKRWRDKKEKQVDCSSRVNVSSGQSPNADSSSFTILHSNDRHSILPDGPIIDGATQYLLEENAQVLSQIKSNLHNLKLQENIDLFFRIKNNTDNILRRMSEMPGIMSQMPPLPVSINDEPVNVNLLGTPQAPFFGVMDGNRLKQKSWCDASVDQGTYYAL